MRVIIVYDESDGNTNCWVSENEADRDAHPVSDKGNLVCFSIRSNLAV
jgi:hypothetical protein